MYIVGANYVLATCMLRAGSVLYLVNKKVPNVLQKYQVYIASRINKDDPYSNGI